MKANEAPEEIYLLPDSRNPNHLSFCWYEAPYRTGAVEYIRADAFIEKACKWFEEHFEDIGLEWLRGYNADEVIENFKEYIRGK